MTKEMKIKEIKTLINNSGFLDNSEYNNSYLWIGVDVLSEFNERFLSCLLLLAHWIQSA